MIDQWIVGNARSRRIGSVAAMIAVVLTAIIIPLAVYCSFVVLVGDTPEWSVEPLRASLQDGRFWQQPMLYIVQRDTTLGHSISEDGSTLLIGAGFACVIALVVAPILNLLSMMVASVITGRSRYRRVLSKQTTGIFEQHRLAEGLFGRLGKPEMMQLERDGEQWQVGFAKRSFVVQARLKKPITEIVVDSLMSNIARRESVDIVVPPDTEVVLDGTTFENFHIYTNVDSHLALARALDTETVAILNKYVYQADLFIGPTLVTAIYDARAIKNEAQVDDILRGLNLLVTKLADSRGAQRRLADQKVLPTRRYIVLFGRPIRLWKAVSVMLIAYAYIAIWLLLTPGRATESELVAFSTLSGWLCLLVFWHLKLRAWLI